MQRNDLNSWLHVVSDGDLDGDYHHMRLSETSAGAWKSVLTQLVKYLESAHRDARDLFHQDHVSSLDPVQPPPYEYPRDLPLETKKGFFGEAFCGIIAEALEVVGRRKWVIPIFLFRLHMDAEDYLARLIFGEQPKGTVPGRRGTDFIALSLDADGSIEEVLAGESKCHEVLNITKAHEALTDLASASTIPVSLRQMKRILQELDPITHERIILSIEKIVLEGKETTIKRTDLFVYVFGNPGIKTYSAPRITPEAKSKYYTCARRLQIAEVHIRDAEQLITEAYNAVYQTPGGN